MNNKLIKTLRLSELKRLIYAILYRLTRNHRYYFYFKWLNINHILRDDNLLAVFRVGGNLPENYGVGIDERIVEYPWVLSHLNDGSGNILDAGSTFNFWPIISHDKIKNKKLTIMTLAPESKNFPIRNVSYVYGDLRSIPSPDNYFDIIVCISTLEHVGMDNAEVYIADSRYKENKVEDYLVAVSELKRILKPGGNLLITVPFGKYQNFGFFQQFDGGMVNKVIKTFQGQADMYFYKYLSSGWQLSSQEDCNTEEYVEKKWGNNSVAGALAIACINLIKSGLTRKS